MLGSKMALHQRHPPLPPAPLLRHHAACRCPSRTTTATADCLCAASSSTSRTACRQVSSAVASPAHRTHRVSPLHHRSTWQGRSPSYLSACLPARVAPPARTAAIRWSDIDALKDYARTNRDLFEGTTDSYPGTAQLRVVVAWVEWCSNRPRLNPCTLTNPLAPSPAGLLTEHWFMPGNASRLRLHMRRLILGLMAVSAGRSEREGRVRSCRAAADCGKGLA